MSLDAMSDEEILRIVNPIMDNLMDASTDINHPRHIKDFTDRLKAIVTESYLQKVCAKYQDEKGFFAERRFVALFRRPNSVAIIWNQQFTKASGDFVAEALFVQKNGRILVDHAMVW